MNDKQDTKDAFEYCVFYAYSIYIHTYESKGTVAEQGQKGKLYKKKMLNNKNQSSA